MKMLYKKEIIEDNKKLKAENKKLQEEVERLNNIINREIPEWIEKHYGILEPTYYFDWLKELKGSVE